MLRGTVLSLFVIGLVSGGLAKANALPQLRLKLAKDDFFQGERINVELEFTNNNPRETYLVEEGIEANPTRFYAVDEQGRPVTDPLEWSDWWFQHPRLGDFEAVTFHTLGRYSLTNPANEMVWFPKPGTYYLWADREILEAPTPFGMMFRLKSNRVRITIKPMPPDAEEAIIENSMAIIATHNPPAQWNPDPIPEKPLYEAVADLCYLRTPKARAKLMQLLQSRPDLIDVAAEGLLATDEPVKEADEVMSAVKSGKLDPRNAANLYGELMTYPYIQSIQHLPVTPDFCSKVSNQCDAGKSAMLRLLKK